MTNVPRRLPPTQGQRIRNVTVTHASLSGQGRTAAARPVPQSRPTPQIYQAPTGLVTGPAGSGGTSITSAGGGSGTSNASGSGSIAIGNSSGPTGAQGVSIGDTAYAPGLNGVAVGYDAKGLADYTTSIGPYTTANQPGASAFGYGAQATQPDDIVFGTASNHVKIPGALILTDSSGGLHRLVVGTDGALSTVAYP